MTMRLPSVAEDGATSPNESGFNQPINIKIARTGLRSEKKTRKLMDIIKGYEAEKMKQHLSKDELELLVAIEEFKHSDGELLKRAESIKDETTNITSTRNIGDLLKRMPTYNSDVSKPKSALLGRQKTIPFIAGSTIQKVDGMLTLTNGKLKG